MVRGKDKQIRVRARKWDLSKALQLRLVKHLTYKEIGIVMGVSPQAITQGLKDLETLIDRPELVKAFRDNEAEVTDGIRLLAAQAIGEQLSDPKRRKKLDLLRLNNLYGTFFDKSRLMRGEATSIINQLSKVIEMAHTDKEKSEEAVDVTPE